MGFRIGARGPSPGEFAMLQQTVDRIVKRIWDIDEHGTRGVSTLSVRIDELVKDLADIKGDMNGKFTEIKNDVVAWLNKHELEHDKDRERQIKGRRWLIGTLIAGGLLLVGIITLLIQISATIHG